MNLNYLCGLTPAKSTLHIYPNSLLYSVTKKYYLIQIYGFSFMHPYLFATSITNVADLISSFLYYRDLDLSALPEKENYSSTLLQGKLVNFF